VAAHTPNTVVREGGRQRPSGEEPQGWPILFPGVPEELEEAWRPHHKAIALAFALADADHHALTLNSGDWERTELGHPQARGVELTITHNFRELQERPKGQIVDNKKGAADNKL
jgi:hypothetical protein